MGDYRISADLQDKFNFWLENLQEIDLDQMDDIYFREYRAMSACTDSEVSSEFENVSFPAEDNPETITNTERYFNSVDFLQGFHVLQQLGDYYLVIRENSLVHDMFLRQDSNASYMHVNDRTLWYAYWLELLTANPETEDDYDVAYRMLIGGYDFTNNAYESELESLEDVVHENLIYAKPVSTGICSSIREDVHEEYGLDLPASQ